MTISFADLHAKYDGFYAPAFELTVGEETYTEADGVVTDIEVDSPIDGAARFVATVVPAFDRRDEAFDVAVSDAADGDPVTIALGYADRLEPVFVGRVRSVRPEFAADGGPLVEVSGYDYSYDMTLETKSRSWDETTDSDVVRAVGSEYDFGAVEAEPTGIEHAKLFQERTNDYRLLRRLADRNGYELFVAGDTLRFRAPNHDAEPTVALRYGDSLDAFSPEFTEAARPSEVEVRHWDPAGKREIVGTASTGASGGRRVIRRPVRSREEADREAAAALEQLLDGVVDATGETVGLPELRVGERLRLDGLGTFTNVYYVLRITHRVGRSGFGTSFEVTERTR